MTKCRFTGTLFLAAIALALSGCGSDPYPAHLAYPNRADLIVVKTPDANPDTPPEAGQLDAFLASLNDRGGKTFNPAELPPEKSKQLHQALHHSFGTPGSPLMRAEDDESKALVNHFQLHGDRLAEGSKLFRRHCLQCHGLTGDGRGPTGPWIYPMPRDYRQGVFKFVSSDGSAARKPARDDLQRVLRLGVERTSMPKFELLPQHERDLLIGYVIHLSVRGEVEYRTMKALLSDADEPPGDDLQQEVRREMSRSLRQWFEADTQRIEATTTPTPGSAEERLAPEHLESIRRGFRLFTQKDNGCIACHEDYGRQAKYRYDVWGTVVRPANLVEGAYRGGKTPGDLYWRIRGGIGPSGMPAATSLTEPQVWDLVHFVLALPYKNALPPDVRDQVYPK